jgi:hypothetical protein
MYFVKEVGRVVDELVKDNKAFTVFDITRILVYRFPIDITFNHHDQVKAAVEDYYFTSQFDAKYTRAVGYQLNISPLNPQIYFPQGEYDTLFTNYDRNALDPNPRPKAVLNTTESPKVTKLSVYAVKDIASRLFWGRKSKSSNRRLTGFHGAQLYGERRWADQLKRYHNGSEVIEFKVVQA